MENLQLLSGAARRGLELKTHPAHEEPRYTPTMRFLTMQRPIMAAVSSAAWSRAVAPAPRIAQLANVLVQGRRHASVKAQGAYKKKSKRGIPKKLGAKRTGGMCSYLRADDDTAIKRS